MKIYTEQDIERFNEALKTLSDFPDAGDTCHIFPTHDGIRISNNYDESELACSNGAFFVEAIFGGGSLKEELTRQIIKDLTSTLKQSESLDFTDDDGHADLRKKIESDADAWKLGWADGEY